MQEQNKYMINPITKSNDHVRQINLEMTETRPSLITRVISDPHRGPQAARPRTRIRSTSRSKVKYLALNIGEGFIETEMKNVLWVCLIVENVAADAPQ